MVKSKFSCLKLDLLWLKNKLVIVKPPFLMVEIQFVCMKNVDLTMTNLI